MVQLSAGCRCDEGVTAYGERLAADAERGDGRVVAHRVMPVTVFRRVATNVTKAVQSYVYGLMQLFQRMLR